MTDSKRKHRHGIYRLYAPIYDRFMAPSFADGHSKMYNSPDQNNQFEESTTLINNEARVYKGGSWLDRAYYLDPAQRRYYPESMTSNFIGFRCAMSYLGESRNSKKSRKR